ncbi:hypothetical protein BPAE_0098g00160 [Botrytis paeoniae]|uniref:Uncharacterized protein n=1 Tax=Botrytis paeoniae TaxID=278948 RepID=A0A4Z1FSC1_9HELO|nr:hypothetical protein BPAE_0098g00160 [Botrytis paeoniae]
MSCISIIVSEFLPRLDDSNKFFLFQPAYFEIVDVVGLYIVQSTTSLVSQATRTTLVLRGLCRNYQLNQPSYYSVKFISIQSLPISQKLNPYNINSNAKARH